MRGRGRRQQLLRRTRERRRRPSLSCAFCSQENAWRACLVPALCYDFRERTLKSCLRSASFSTSTSTSAAAKVISGGMLLLQRNASAVEGRACSAVVSGLWRRLFTKGGLRRGVANRLLEYGSKVELVFVSWWVSVFWSEVRSTARGAASCFFVSFAKGNLKGCGWVAVLLVQFYAPTKGPRYLLDNGQEAPEVCFRMAFRFLHHFFTSISQFWL